VVASIAPEHTALVFYSMMKTRRKITKIFSFTPPFADRSCVLDASSRFLQEASIDVDVSIMQRHTL